MKKQSALIILFFIFLTSTAFAAPDKRNEHANENADKKQNQNVVQLLEKITITPTETLTITPTPTGIEVEPTIVNSPTPSAACDENAEWKNHGSYVQCVAKLHLGGQTTSQAARSNVGKKNGAPTISPTITVTATPSVTITPTVTITPPITAPEAEASFSFWPDFSGLKKQFARLFKFFTNN
jgi:hypothetical protein